MWIQAATSLALMAAATGAQSAALPEAEFTATVAAVVQGDAVRIDTGGEEVLVGLYGVSCFLRRPEAREAAAEFVRTHTAGDEVTVRVLEEVAGLPYAEIVLPAGEVLNHMMLSRGVADPDPLTARDDEHYAMLAETARSLEADAGMEAETEAAPEPPVVERRTPQPGEAPESIEAFKARRQLREVAAFEAGREKWLAMPEEYRDRVRREYEEALEATSRRTADSLAALQSQVDLRRNALNNAQAGIAERQAVAFGGFVGGGIGAQPLRTPVNAGQNAGTFADLSRTAQFGRPSGFDPPVFGGVAQPRQRFVNPWENAMAMQALAAEQRVQAEALRIANTRLQTARAQANDRTGRLLQALARFELYEEAAEEGLPSPTLSLRPVTRYESNLPQEPAPFLVDEPVMRIDWHASAPRPGARVTGIVYEAEGDRPVARFSSASPPHEAFRILDGDGEYYIETETDGTISYTIEVFGVDE